MVKRNRIHDGRDSGVLVCENGKGSVVDNDIFANQVGVRVELGVRVGRKEALRSLLSTGGLDGGRATSSPYL